MAAASATKKQNLLKIPQEQAKGASPSRINRQARWSLAEWDSPPNTE